MARIHELLVQLRASAPMLAADIEREFDVLAERRAFGLNFERHMPEVVELPGRKIRVGDKVRVQPPRGAPPVVDDGTLYRVTKIEREGGLRVAVLAVLGTELGHGESVEGSRTVDLDDLVVVAEFRDPIYPGLVSTGKVERGGGELGDPGAKPYHAVINAENFHALQTLLFTHRAAIDVIYVDPPYNTGNEWIYNDKYVASNDIYRHSKWLAFIERRLLLAKELLKPSGALCVSIGSDEVHRLKLLIEQTFPEKVVQVITVQVTAGGKSTSGVNTLNEYLVCATPEDFVPSPMSFTGGVSRTPWEGLVLATFNRTQRPNQTYPIFIDTATGGIHSVGASLTELQRNGSYIGTAAEFRFETEPPPGTVAIWPITTKGEECVWRLAPDRLLRDWEKGYIKVSPNRRQGERNLFSVQYLPAGVIAKVERGDIPTLGTVANTPTLSLGENTTAGAAIPSIWVEPQFRTSVGNDHLKKMFGDKRFPYPKPVQLISDVVRGFAQAGGEAVILDFFAGSGTTLEAVMAANAGDMGNRRAILITNNEVSAGDSALLAGRGHRKDEAIWNARGVFELVARPRIEIATTGKRPDGSTFSHGYDENVEFFTLTYEAPMRIQSNREFARIAPFLWLRSGSRGRRIDSVENGWDVADAYGVLSDLDQTDVFLEAVAASPDVKVVFIVTDEDRLFQAVVRDLPPNVEPVRMYESYLRNFEIDAMRSLR